MKVNPQNKTDLGAGRNADAETEPEKIPKEDLDYAAARTGAAAGEGAAADPAPLVAAVLDA